MRARSSLLVLPGYLALTLVLTWPLLREISSAVPAAIGTQGEVLGGPFVIGWVLKTLFRDPGQVFHLPIFHPEPLALAYSDHLIGEALMAAPAVSLTGSLALGYNRVIILSFVASAWAAYRLTRLVGVSRSGAFLAGLLFAFAPFRYSNLGFLNQITTEFLPLGLFFALRFVRRWRRRDLAGATATLVAQSYCGWYYTLYLALAYVLLALYAWAAGWLRRGRVPWRAVGVAALAGAVLVLPGLLPYLELRRIMPGFGRTLGMTAMYSADLLDYVKTSRGNWLAGRWLGLTTGLACWPGLVTVPLALVGLASLWRERRRAAEVGYFAALGGVAFLLSLGPVLHVAGKQLPIPLAYGAVYFLFPGFSALRGPARLAVLVLLAAVVLAGVGYDRWLRRLGARGERVLFAGFAAVAVISSLNAVARVPLPRRDAMPPAYDWLARRPGSFAILELPIPATESEEDSVDLVRQFHILHHGRPTLDGVSGFVPPAVRRLRLELQSFPDRDVLREAALRGARYVVVHLEELTPEARAEWRRTPAPSGLVPRVRFGDDLVLELDPALTASGGRGSDTPDTRRRTSPPDSAPRAR